MIAINGVCLGDQIVTKAESKGPNRNSFKMGDQNRNTRKDYVVYLYVYICGFLVLMTSRICILLKSREDLSTLSGDRC